jgi:16S rRNA (guanine1207-N2)-methyltransferase
MNSMAAITAHFQNQAFTFSTDSDVFSPGQLDVGSRLLLETVVAQEKPKSIIDIGGGYGAMGIILAKYFPDANVLMVDNNPAAVKLAKENAAVNLTANAKTEILDVTRQTIGQRFDLAVTNPPWTKNKSVIPGLVRFAFDHLLLGGKFYLVINQTFKTEDIVDSIFGNVELVATREPYKIIRATKTSNDLDPLRAKLQQLGPKNPGGQFFLASSPNLDRVTTAAKTNHATEVPTAITPGIVYQPLLHKLAHRKTGPVILILPEKTAAHLLAHHIFPAVFDIDILFNIPRSHFYPVAPTNTAVVLLRRNPDPVTKDNMSKWLSRFLYFNEGKTLNNTLRLAIEEISQTVFAKKLTKNQARKIVAGLKLDPQLLARVQYSAEVYNRSTAAIVAHFASAKIEV